MNPRGMIKAAAFAVTAFGAALPANAQVPSAPGGGRGAPAPLPLVSTRKAEFTATKGTWISLDVSPDGKTIVFDLLGDLYTLPIDGGKATRITSGMAFDAQPRYSPDGRKIVFVSDRSGGDNLWTLTTDLKDTTQITMGNGNLYVSPEWTPDGKYIIGSRSTGLGGSAKLFAQHVDTRAPMMLSNIPAAHKTIGGAWSPDGNTLWYAARAGDWTYNAQLPQYQIYSYNRATATPTMQSNRYGSAFRPAVSPDGKWLVYGSRERTDTGLRVRNIESGDEDWLAYPVQRDDQESRAPLDVLPGYSFTPDSKFVVASYGGEIWRIPMDKSAATKIPFEAEVKTEIGPEVKFDYRVDTTTMVSAKQIRHPVVSPDGKSLAFTAFDRLYIKSMPDGTPRRLSSAEVGEFHPQWSPDGKWLAYVSWNDGNGGHIMKVATTGSSQPVQLTQSAALYTNVAWSTDGKRVVASRGAARDLKEESTFGGTLGGQFVWVPAEGGALTVIAPSGTRDVMHFRTNEPDRIYAYSFVEGLVSFRWDGTDVKPHLRVGAPPGGGGGTPHDEPKFLPRRVFPIAADPDAPRPAEGALPFPPADLVMIAPTGDFALASVGNDIYSVMIPSMGGPVPTLMLSAGGGQVPMRKLTDVGGEFPAWSADGKRVHWAIGNAFVTYDLARAQFMEDSVKTRASAARDSATRVRAMLDTLKQTRAKVDSLTKAKAPIPDSLKTRLNALRADSISAGVSDLLARADSIASRAAAIRARADSARLGLDTARVDTVPGYRPREQRIGVTMARDIPKGTYVLRGGRAVTMKGKDIIENADIVITNDRIVAIGMRDSVAIPAGAHVVDVTGKTLLPGFVDTHYHPQWLVPEIHPGQAWQFLTTLAFGVTTTRDPQTGTTDILSYQDRVDTGGMLGPRVYSTGPGVFSGESVRNLEHAKTILRRYSEYYDTKTLKMYMTGNRQQRQWIIQAAKELNLMPTTEGGLDFKLELTHAIDGYSGVEHSLPIAPIFDDVVQLFKASGTTNSPTLLVSYGGPFGENWFYTHENPHENEQLRRFMPEDHLDWKTRRRGTGAGGHPGPAAWFLDEEYVHPLHAQFVKNMVEGGGRIGVGSHGQLQGLGYHWEMWALGSGGATPHDVLRSATIMGAEAIGLGSDIGTLEVGKMADILVLDRDPLTDLRNTTSVKYIVKNGRMYDASTLDEVYPRQKKLPPQFWMATGPSGVRAGIR